MVDVLSWLQTDHGYCEESDMLSSEASASPHGSDTGKFLPFSPSPNRQEDKQPADSTFTAQAQHSRVTRSSGSVSGRSIISAGKDTSIDPFTDRNKKNAESARLNRQKKKQYVNGIEQELESLKTENKKLQTKCGNYENAFKRLTQEVEYLTSVIHNQSTLSTLLQNIPQAGGARLKSSLPPAKRPRLPEDGRQQRDKCSSSGSGGKFSGGVCLHVARDNVCIEFCSHCSKNACTD